MVRPVAAEHGPLIESRRENSVSTWLAKEMNLTALAKEYKELFPDLWEILYFVMFLSLLVKKLLVKKFFTAARAG